ncbi:nucleotide exchange factor GrpE [Vagococcus intermedius]|uniref:Protein GrpE n=1 Tax=Vagococcus intermedius TaxID=2991418 RepID=A0AAF0I551_9ENTE|nr:nucleotide exchange factor GrpE [Vagococcus intermedius]WEG72748.1 nucleotide exchange factor GrpE [Vagococcus intermedius]WEG74834.1 nucleotide exchange factor GrpE [Vagococcus intermedius]
MTENKEELNKQETTEEVDEETKAKIDEILGETEADLSSEEVPEKTKEELLQEQLSEMEDKFLRAQAEIANMRNRNIKDREAAAKYRSQDLGKELLPAIDNLERALAIEVTDEQGESLKKGIEMVMESVLHAMKSAGIEEISAMGEIFDPNLHQAVQTAPVEGNQKSDEIINVLQKGYILHDRVLRPSMVIVAQ